MATIAKKLGTTTDGRTYFVNAPPEMQKKIAGRDIAITQRLAGKFDYIHAFVITQKKLDATFSRLRKHLAPQGKLWISWPKNRQLDTDLTLATVIKIGYDHGLVESKTIGLDTTWSAIKFTHPIAGKRYQNSYGKLNARPMVARDHVEKQLPSS